MWRKTVIFLGLGVAIDQLVAWWAVRHASGIVNPYHALGVPLGSEEFRLAVAWILAGAIWRLGFARRAAWGFGLMLAGLASNTISFLLYGRFVDYLPLGPYTTNPADIAITLGGIVVVWSLLFGSDALDQGV